MPEHIANGLLAGLVAITAGCATVTTVGAMVIGAAAGGVMYAAVHALERLRIDDVVGAVAVHGCCGAFGTVALVFFVAPGSDAATTPMATLLWAQIQGVLVCFVWTFGGCYGLFSLLNHWMPLRVPPEDEIIGLNVSEHGASSSLLELANAMQRVTQEGRYDVSSLVAVEHGTEVGDLARLFNALVTTTGAHQDRTRDSAGAVHGSAGELAVASDDLDRRIAQMADQSVEATDATGRIRDEVGGVATAVSELTDAIHEIARSAATGAELADSASALVGEAQETVEALCNDSRRIVGVVELIRSLARQTNMLALNASIEAHRAGESGFVVVAQEVKALAEQTAQSSNVIEQLAADIVSQGGAAQETAGRMAEIVHELKGGTHTIAAAVEEQSVTCNVISGRVSRAAESSHGVEGAVKAMSVAARATTESTSSVRDTANTLSSLAGDLRDAVDRAA